MPNTLAHIGIQGLATRSILKNADYKWILIGCIIPDVPWILQRAVRMIANVNPYDLRLYVTVQASLLFCIILSLALSTFSKQYWKVLLILCINSFLHLVLDALQKKWANGVHLFSPFDWQFINFGLFWPEGIISYILTGFGFLFFWLKWPDSFKSRTKPELRPLPLMLFISIYIFLPLLFLSGPEKADNHFVKTLRNFETRAGKYIEIDRASFIDENNKVVTYAGEEIDIEGIKQNGINTVSLQGIFVSNNLIKVSKYHVHQSFLRDYASYVGLALVTFYWFCCMLIWTANKIR